MSSYGGINLDDVAADAEGAAAQVFGALVLDIDEAVEHGFAGGLLAFFEHDQHAVIGFGGAHAVDAGDRGDDDDVAAFEQSAGGAHAELVELVVDGGFLVDVQIGGGDVGFGLVVVVVADEIFDGVFGEEGFELVVELCGERFVVSQDQSGAVQGFDDLCHREGLAGAGDAQQDLVFVAGFDAADELVDGGGLVAAGLVGAAKLEFHAARLLLVCWGVAKLLLYSGAQVDGWVKRLQGRLLHGLCQRTRAGKSASLYQVSPPAFGGQAFAHRRSVAIWPAW